MPELCTDCPLRGSIGCEVIGTVEQRDTTVMLTKNWGFKIGDLGAVVDREGKVSEVLNFSQAAPETTTLGAIVERIDGCTQPIERKGFLNRLFRRPAVCGALGDLAIDDSYPYDVAAANHVQPRLARKATLIGRAFPRP